MSIRIRNLNNATTYIESKDIKLLIDPWLVGNLYNNAWSPYEDDIHFSQFSKITHVFISHIHQDHWDIDTLKKINRDAIIFIPKFGFNNIIKKTLSNLCFANIKMQDVGCWFDIDPDISAYIVPPLNSMAQDIEWYENKSQGTPVAIDTGIIVKDRMSDTTHLILADNSPYDTELLKFHLSDEKVDSFWFNYNGFAQDYPLCYDNLSLSEKKEISLNMSTKGEVSTLKAIKAINPRYLIPHSSDFVLNGPRKDEFLLVHSSEFLDKKKYAKRIKKLTGIPAYALFSRDYIEFKKLGVVSVFCDRTVKNNPRKSTKELTIPILEDLDKKPILPLLKIALKHMMQSCQHLNIPIGNFQDWYLKLILDDGQVYILDFEKQVVLTSAESDKKILTLQVSLNIMYCILNKRLHINNCQIGCYLTWQRVPNEFNKWLDDALNFLHV